MFRSLSYKDIVHLCQTDRNFRDICNSPRGKQLIEEVLIHDLGGSKVFDVLIRSSSKQLSGIGDSNTRNQLMDEYIDITTDVIADILMKNNYSNDFYDRALKYINDNIEGSVRHYKIETRYTPMINNLLTALYQRGLEYDWILNLIYALDRKNYTPVDYSKVNKIFFKRHPELLRYFKNTLMQ